jgi:hypothetical protein
MSEKERELSLREEYSKLYPPQKLRVRIKGVCYCVGTGEATGGHAYRLSDEDMKKDVGDIHGTLGCNGIKIYGDNQERIVKCARMAIEKGFDRILLLPWYVEATHDELVKEQGKLAKKAEELRKEAGDKIVLMIGNELTVSSVGIYPGGSYWARSNQIAELQNNEECKKKLEELVRDLTDVSRKEGFGGDLSYAPGTWEWWLPWDKLDLDILGDNLYWYGEFGNPEDPNNIWFRHVKHYKRYGKPYYDTEFGSPPMKGAFDMGASTWMDLGTVARAVDEDAQAESDGKYMELFNKADDMGLTVDGCFLFRYFGGPDGHNPYAAWEDCAVVVPEYSTTLGNPPVDHWRKAFYMYKSYQRSA